MAGSGINIKVLSADISVLSADIVVLSADIVVLSADKMVLSADIMVLSADNTMYLNSTCNLTSTFFRLFLHRQSQDLPEITRYF
jgi:hypothetical protein